MGREDEGQKDFSEVEGVTGREKISGRSKAWDDVMQGRRRKHVYRSGAEGSSLGRHRG